jgi:hypothetical protein
MLLRNVVSFWLVDKGKTAYSNVLSFEMFVLIAKHRQYFLYNIMKY